MLLEMLVGVGGLERLALLVVVLEGVAWEVGALGCLRPRQTQLGRRLARRVDGAVVARSLGRHELLWCVGKLRRGARARLLVLGVRELRVALVEHLRIKGRVRREAMAVPVGSR